MAEKPASQPSGSLVSQLCTLSLQLMESSVTSCAVKFLPPEEEVRAQPRVEIIGKRIKEQIDG